MSTEPSALSIPLELVNAVAARLASSDEGAVAPSGLRPGHDLRPAHVLYGGAHLFRAGSPAKMGALARAAMDEWGSDAVAFGRIVGVDEGLAPLVAQRVRDKLAAAPVESMCIDFEDGYGPRADDEEDADALRTAGELAAVAAGAPRVGIRIKPLGGGTTKRALRTLDLFVTALARATGGALRAGFTVTLPKVVRRDEVAALVEVLESLESRLTIPRIDVELMIETPRAIIDERGAVAIRALVDAGRGRVAAVHLGAYDLTAELGVTAADQRLDHPYCDLARALLRLATYGVTEVSDGATTLLPIAPKDAPPAEREAAVHRAWAAHARNVRRALELGIWQGWDLHPAQLPARYGVLHAYFLEHRASAAARLATFVERATQASRVGQVFDDAATARGLVEFFQRGLSCGALEEADLRPTTLTTAELEALSAGTKSFADVAALRRGTVVA